jgi:small basic protein (TIGR04137 family)
MGQINHWQGGGGRDRNRVCFHAEAGRSTREFYMSQHRSLRAIATVGGKRNVLKRFERVGILKKRSQWKEGDRITGLRKTKPDA